MHNKPLINVFTLFVSISSIFILFLGISCAKGGKSDLRNEHPNVLLIMIDDLNDYVGPLTKDSGINTPNMDRLATQSVLFKRAYSPAVICNPSRTSILTGLSPLSLNIFNNSTWFRDVDSLKNVVTLPEYFHKQGYKTLATGKIFHEFRGAGILPNRMSCSECWDEQRKGFVPPEKPKVKPDLGMNVEENHFILKEQISWGRTSQEIDQVGDVQSANWVVSQLKKDQKKPFFLACGIFIPHLPWYLPSEFDVAFDMEKIYIPDSTESDLDDISTIEKNRIIESGIGEVLTASKNWKNAKAAYLESICFIDLVLGIIMEGLESSPYKDNTIVMLVSDHGFHVGEKMYVGKYTLWEQGTHVPFIIKSPGATPAIVNNPVSTLAMFPTLLELAGLPPNPTNVATSLVKFIENPTLTDSSAVFTFRGPSAYAIRKGQFRYIKYEDGSEEFYDLQSDPRERINLIFADSHQNEIDDFRKIDINASTINSHDQKS
jgi:arylsulfatase A-like enzyme